MGTVAGAFSAIILAKGHIPGSAWALRADRNRIEGAFLLLESDDEPTPSFELNEAK